MCKIIPRLKAMIPYSAAKFHAASAVFIFNRKYFFKKLFSSDISNEWLQQIRQSIFPNYFNELIQALLCVDSPLEAQRYSSVVASDTDPIAHINNHGDREIKSLYIGSIKTWCLCFKFAAF